MRSIVIIPLYIIYTNIGMILSSQENNWGSVVSGSKQGEGGTKAYHVPLAIS